MPLFASILASPDDLIPSIGGLWERRTFGDFLLHKHVLRNAVVEISNLVHDALLVLLLQVAVGVSLSLVLLWVEGFLILVPCLLFLG